MARNDLAKYYRNGKLSEELLIKDRTNKCSTCPITKVIRLFRKEGKVGLGSVIALNSCNVVSSDCVMDIDDIVEFTM